MLNDRSSPMRDYLLISRAAHVIERSGLAMAGAMCGIFVAAQLANVNVALFSSIGFLAAMVLVGMIGFYLGIDLPRWPADAVVKRRRGDLVEVLSATGTFLTAVAALISVCTIILDEAPQRAWEFAVGSWWFVGVIMQIGAGLVARLRPQRRVGKA
jgi:hypothetical protein